jgi:hypothetical protein
VESPAELRQVLRTYSERYARAAAHDDERTART